MSRSFAAARERATQREKYARGVDGGGGDGSGGHEREEKRIGVIIGRGDPRAN